MFILLIFMTSAFEVDFTNLNKKLCSCKNYPTETICQNYNSQGCTWSKGECYSLPCNEVLSSIQCETRPNCVFDIKQKCISFTSCEDISYDPEKEYEKCLLKGCYKGYNYTADGKLYCQSKPQFKQLNCVDLKDSKTCLTSQQGQEFCMWDNNKNTCGSWEDCTTYSDYQQICESLEQCHWRDGKCNQLQCSDFKPDSCDWVFDYTKDKFISCLKHDGQCQQAKIDWLTEESQITNALNANHGLR
ncbi:hypothetical protein pb186bvf_012376 [Paramecium bursaria]